MGTEVDSTLQFADGEKNTDILPTVVGSKVKMLKWIPGKWSGKKKSFP